MNLPAHDGGPRASDGRADRPHGRALTLTSVSFALSALLFSLGLAACEDSDADSSGSTSAGSSCSSAPLFGRPNSTTGLDASQCAPVRAGCGVDFEERPWTPPRIAVLRQYTQLEAPAELVGDPYAEPVMAAPEAAVCAVVIVDAAARTYRVTTFASQQAALDAGAIVTHVGGCGLCSSLADLAVYAEQLDLTAPVRQCGISSLGDLEANRACLEDLGFSSPCAQIWAYNTANTRAHCLAVCSQLLDAPYHEPDGALNACLQCDEEQSGPVFKAVAGRTRRNTGIASALCRPCDEVARLAHDYP